MIYLRGWVGKDNWRAEARTLKTKRENWKTFKGKVNSAGRTRKRDQFKKTETDETKGGAHMSDLLWHIL